MKSTKRICSQLLFFSLLVFFSQCSKDEIEKEIENPNTPLINDFFEPIPDWDNTTKAAEPDEIIDAELIVRDGNTPHKCQVVEKNLVRSLGKIISVGTNKGKIWPGAIFQGISLESGEFELINIDKAPITITVDLPIDKTFREIEKPNSVTLQQAISEMQIEAGNLKEGSQAGAGIMNFEITEASSFKQTMLDMGITGGFTEPQSEVGLEASASISTDRSVREHTVIAKFIQEKFTVRLADDLIPTTADFFKDDVTVDELEALEKDGVIGTDNIPLYIESVTYGRILLFTMKSTEVNNSNELSAALNASMADYVEGGANLTQSEQTILNNSETTIFSAGGTEEGSNAVIANLDWSKFFCGSPCFNYGTNLFHRKNFKRKKIVKLHNNISYEMRDDCMEPSTYDITVTLDQAILTSGVCLVCSYNFRMSEDGSLIPTPIAYGRIWLVWDGYGIGSGIYQMIDNALGSSFTVSSSICTSAGSSPIICAAQNVLSNKSNTYNFPYDNLISGNTKISHNLTSALRSVRLDYTIRKTAKYQ